MELEGRSGEGVRYLNQHCYTIHNGESYSLHVAPPHPHVTPPHPFRPPTVVCTGLNPFSKVRNHSPPTQKESNRRNKCRSAFKTPWQCPGVLKADRHLFRLGIFSQFKLWKNVLIRKKKKFRLALFSPVQTSNGCGKAVGAHAFGLESEILRAPNSPPPLWMLL